MAHRVRLALGTLLVVLGTTPAPGQEAGASAVDGSAAPRASARATMRSFLEAANVAAAGEVERLEDAVLCLDLEDLDPRIRARKGRELAIDLKEIVDRTRLVNYDAVPDDPGGGPWVFLRDGHGEVVIARAANGEWLFTKSTVASIPAMLTAAMTRDRVAGVPDSPRSLAPSAWIRSLVPSGLRRPGLLLEHWQWLAIVLLVFVGVVVDRLVAAAAVSSVHTAYRRILPTGDLDLVRSAARPLGLVAMAALWWTGVFWLGLPPAMLTVLLVAVKFLAAAAGVWAAYRFVDVLGEYLAARAAATENRFDDLLVPLVRKSLKTITITFGLVFIADNLNVNITSLVAGLGLGGLAFALAAQDTVKNLFGSLTVILDRPFRVGDWIVIGDTEGTVEEVGFRSTRVRSFYNSLITIPNANLIQTPVDNLGARSYRRWKSHLSVTYDTPAEKIEAFCEGIRELVRRHPTTRKDYFHVYANEYGPASLNVLLYVFFHTPDWGAELQARHDLFLDILRLAERLGVEFAFPTQTLHVLRPGEMPEHEPLGDVSEAQARGRAEADAIRATVAQGRAPRTSPDVGSGGEAG